MQGIKPRTLSNSELIRYASLDMEANHDTGMSLAYQVELLRRFTELAPIDEHPTIDSKQLALPL